MDLFHKKYKGKTHSKAQLLYKSRPVFPYIVNLS